MSPLVVEIRNSTRTRIAGDGVASSEFLDGSNARAILTLSKTVTRYAGSIPVCITFHGFADSRAWLPAITRYAGLCFFADLISTIFPAAVRLQ